MVRIDGNEADVCSVGLNIICISNIFTLIVDKVVNIDKKVDEMKRKFHEALNNVTMRVNSDLITADKYKNLVQECKIVKKSETLLVDERL